ncbi:MAG TPA: outer-membrane lipoprotein carrier protein LolA [Caulobacteraceae bacterium]|nr:outer-membrane lipoprotein carrier protein LolA [Caulobacteraceae bacterium]
MRLTRRLALAALAAAFAPAFVRAATTPEDDALVARAVAYLDALTSVKGAFQQTDQRGGVANGMFYLARPGRARFEYAAPSGLLVTSDGKTVIVSNSRLKTFQRFPLSSTPLSLFLAAHIRLDKGARVTRVDRGPNGYSVTAEGARGLNQGQITLYFSEAPLRLIGWAVTDAQGRSTRVSLGPLTPIESPDSDLFTQSPST